MRSDPTPRPTDAAGAPNARPTPRPVVVPIEQIAMPPEWGSEWTSETSADKPEEPQEDRKTELMPADGPALRRRLAIAETKITRPEPEVAPVVVAAAPSRFTWRNIAMALLAVVIVAQAGVIAFWMRSGGVAAAAPNTGSVTVTSEPNGSPVMIDGVVRGVTPLTLAIEPGAHRVEVGGGAQLRSQNVNVTRGGDASLHLELAAAGAAAATGTGGLEIATQPAGARVWIDGEARGVAPITVPNLKIGEHAITVRNNAGEAVNRTVTVQEGTVASLVISMAGAGGFASGWLAITSGVPLQIWEKGALVGTTDTPRIMLPAGNHELELVNASLGYRVSRSVQVSAGQTAAVAIKPPMGMLSINALPWAEVWIDGQRAGETPIGNFSIAIGNHELIFRHPELGEQRKTVTVGAQAPARVGVDMRKP